MFIKKKTLTKLYNKQNETHLKCTRVAAYETFPQWRLKENVAEFIQICGIGELPRTQNLVFRREKRTNGGESVAGVGNKQAGFAHSTIPNSDALDEPRSAHLWNSEKRKETPTASDLHLRTRSHTPSNFFFFFCLNDTSAPQNNNNNE